MKKLKIKTEKPLINNEEILATKKPFSQIFNQFHAIPKFKIFLNNNILWIGAIVTVAIVTVVVLVVSPTLFFPKNEKKSVEICVADSSKPFVKQPLKNIGVSYNSETFDNTKSYEIVTPTGTKIHIPENAFVDQNQKLVNEPVTLLYREFHNPVDIFLSGIPMRYDSLKSKNIFESGGMIEVQAKNGDKPLQLAKGKSIDVELVSNNCDPDINLYYLDTIKKNWVYVGKDKISKPTDKKDNSTINKSQNINKKEPTSSKNFSTYVKPRKADKNRNIFKVNYDSKQFPEFAIYKNILFEIDETYKAFNKECYKINWDQISLKRINKEDNLYEIKLQKRDSIVKLVSHAVIEEKEFKAAFKAFNEETISKNATEKTIAENKSKTKTSMLLITDLKKSLTNNSTRSFSMFQLGIWNCDRPYPIPDLQNFATPINIMADNNGSVIECNQVYVVPLDLNMLIESTRDKLLFKKDHESICFVISHDDKIVIVNSNEFSNAYKANKRELKGRVYEPIAGISMLKMFLKI